MFRRVLLVILFLWTCLASARSEINLPHSDVNAIVQDKQGYLWFATYSGLCKYDGYRLKTYRTSNSGLVHDRVISLLAPSDSLLYIGTESGGLCVYDYKSDSFHPVYSSSQNIIDDVVYSIFEDTQGCIWACHNNTLSQISGNTATNKRLTTRYKSQLSKDVLLSGIALNTEELLISSNLGLIVYNKTTGESSQISDLQYINTLVRYDKDRVLLGASDGLYQIQDKKINKLANSTSIRTLFIDKEKTIWVGTYENGLYKYTDSLEEFLPDVISSNEISALFEDSSNLLWIGTIGGGLNTISLFNNNIECYTTADGLSQNRVITFTEDGDGLLWISSKNGGVDIFDYQEFSNITINGKPSREFYVVSSFYIDPKGQMYIGTWDGGAFRVTSKNHKNINTIRLNLSQGNLSVFKIIEDKDHHLWLSTNKGLYEYYNDKVIRSFRHDQNNPNSLYSDYLTDICIDPNSETKTIWVGTRAGLNKITFNPEPSISRQNFSSDKFITAIHYDKNDNLWISSLSDGLYKINGEKVNQYTFDNNDIESILEDREGNLWLAGFGITKFNPTNSNSITYTAKDNLQSNSFKIWAAHNLSDGRLVFGGPKGFNIINPSNIIQRSNIPNVVISEVRVKDIQISENAVLKYNQNSVSFNFASLSFTNSEYNNYKYRLKGYEDEYHYSHNPTASYLNLPKGHYTFEVYGSNSDNLWNPEAANFSFTVRAHILLSTVAIIIYILIGIGLIYLGYVLIQKRTEELNEQRIQKERLRYFTDMAHEIKTPLSLIAAPVEELLDNQSIGASTRNKLKVVNNGVSTLRTIIEQLLDLRKYEDKMMKLSVSEIDISKFLKETAELFAPYAANKGINLKVEISDYQLVYIDKPKMERVVVNLLSNAIKFTPEGGTVCLRTYSDDKSFSFCVEDNGVGINPEDQQHIFERFYQANNQSEARDSGTGIGLALSKYIVEHHKGEISLESRKDFGSKFTVRLLKGSNHFKPNQINTEYKNSDDLSHYDPITIQEPEPINDKSVTILVVDDNEGLRAYLATLLNSKYNILTAADGLQAYEIAIAEQPDLILSDIVMPKMSGIELCQRIKANEATSHIMVLLLTARNLASTQIESYRVGADGYISKPFQTAVLSSRIENLIEQRDKMRAKFHSTLDVNPSEITIMSSDEKLIAKCLKAIEERIDDSEFGVEELSREVCISKAQLYRKIMAITGLSTIQFIRKIRLKRAAQLLTQDSSSISDVMYKTGFNNLSYFSKLFKEEFGCVPKDYSQLSQNL